MIKNYQISVYAHHLVAHWREKILFVFFDPFVGVVVHGRERCRTLLAGRFTFRDVSHAVFVRENAGRR